MPVGGGAGRAHRSRGKRQTAEGGRPTGYAPLDVILTSAARSRSMVGVDASSRINDGRRVPHRAQTRRRLRATFPAGCRDLQQLGSLDASRPMLWVASEEDDDGNAAATHPPAKRRGNTGQMIKGDGTVVREAGDTA